MNDTAKLLLVFLIISIFSNVYLMNEVKTLQSTLKLTSNYYQAELSRLFDFHLDSIADLNEYYGVKR